MKFVLKIEADNEAFQPDPRVEVARLLRRAADKLEQGDMAGTLRDFNGNTVGEFTFQGRKA